MEPDIIPIAVTELPTIAAGAASTPKINCFDVENIANIISGSIEPYSPYTALKPDICAYPIDIGIVIAAIISPANASFFKYSAL